MKALIRGSDETVTESMHIEGVDWDTGLPLTDPNWCGGPYTLIADYQPEEESPE